MSKPVVGLVEITGKDGPALQSSYSGRFGWEGLFGRDVADGGDGLGYGPVAAGVRGIVVGLSRGAVR